MSSDCDQREAIHAIQKRRETEMAQCDALVAAVRDFIKQHIQDHGPNVRYSDALSMVSLSLMSSRAGGRMDE